MQYISTRGETAARSFSDIVFEGFAPDDGLYVPSAIPKISIEQLRTWKGLSYAALAFEVMHIFAPEIPRPELWRLCCDTYSGENFPKPRDRFSSEEVTPIKWLHDSVGLVEMSNGPTLAFDDIAMQFLVRLYEARMHKEGEPFTLLGATTGDMGCAVEAAFGGHKDIRTVILSPKGRMSLFQAAQLYSCKAENVLNIEVDGTFDQCQDIAFRLLKDRAFAGSHHLRAVNSVLWSRLAPLVVCYFYSYLQAVASVGEEVVYAVPAGNFGNVYAGWLARAMGLPVMRLIVCTNENDAMDEFLRTGRYAPRPSAETLATSSPSTDIARAAGFERFLFEVLGRDAARVGALMTELEEKGSFTLTPEEFMRVRRSGLVSGSSNHPNRVEIIEQMHLEYDTFVDPHTADALFSGIYLHPVGVKTLCMETVQPVKFPRIVKQATGCVVPPEGALVDVFARPLKKKEVPADYEVVRALVEEFSGV